MVEETYFTFGFYVHQKFLSLAKKFLEHGLNWRLRMGLIPFNLMRCLDINGLGSLNFFSWLRRSRRERESIQLLPKIIFTTFFNKKNCIVLKLFRWCFYFWGSISIINLDLILGCLNLSEDFSWTNNIDCHPTRIIFFYK